LYSRCVFFTVSVFVWLTQWKYDAADAAAVNSFLC